MGKKPLHISILCFMRSPAFYIFSSEMKPFTRTVAIRDYQTTFPLQKTRMICHNPNKKPSNILAPLETMFYAVSKVARLGRNCNSSTFTEKMNMHRSFTLEFLTGKVIPILQKQFFKHINTFAYCHSTSNVGCLSFFHEDYEARSIGSASN